MAIHSYILFVATGDSDKKNRVSYFPNNRYCHVRDSRFQVYGQLHRVSVKMPASRWQCGPQSLRLSTSTSVYAKILSKGMHQAKIRTIERQNAERVILMPRGKVILITLAFPMGGRCLKLDATGQKNHKPPLGLFLSIIFKIGFPRREKTILWSKFDYFKVNMELHLMPTMGSAVSAQSKKPHILKNCPEILSQMATLWGAKVVKPTGGIAGYRSHRYPERHGANLPTIFFCLYTLIQRSAIFFFF